MIFQWINKHQSFKEPECFLEKWKIFLNFLDLFRLISDVYISFQIISWSKLNQIHSYYFDFFLENYFNLIKIINSNWMFKNVFNFNFIWKKPRRRRRNHLIKNFIFQRSLRILTNDDENEFKMIFHHDWNNIWIFLLTLKNSWE